MKTKAVLRSVSNGANRPACSFSQGPRTCKAAAPCPRIFRFLITAGLAFAVSVEALAVRLQPEEARIFQLLKNAPDQLRPRSEISVDPILTRVARQRAADMATRGYFGHVNPDGFGPNYLVERAGYRLPDHWGASKTKNYIESIASQYRTGEAAWAGWMSADHRIHLLALNPAFRDQVRVGVGHFFAEGSPDGDYWVVITAPPSGPVVKITSPRRFARTKNRTFQIKGRASAQPEEIQYSVAALGGTTGFTAASGTSQWAAEVTQIQPGRNRILVRSIGQDGSVLARDEVTVKLLARAELEVTVEGNGKVSPGFLGKSTRRVAKRYAIEATPAKGWVFAGWSGNIENSQCHSYPACGSDLNPQAGTHVALSSPSPRLRFRMADGMSLKATFMPSIPGQNP